MTEREREDRLRRWFAMWLNQTDAGMESLFAPDALYIESWGPEYHGLPAIRHWFSEWNRRGRVVTWEIRQFFHKWGTDRGGMVFPERYGRRPGGGVRRPVLGAVER